MEAYLTQITDYLLTQSWQIAILVAVVTFANLVLRNRSAHIRYLLWLIVLAKCFVPPLLTVPLAVLPQDKPMLAPILERPVAPEAAPVSMPSTPVRRALPERAVAPKPARLHPRQWFALAWIGGVAAFVLIAAVKALRTRFWLRRKRKPLPTELHVGIASLFFNLGLKRFPKVWLVEGIGQPFVWGVLRGCIYLPTNFVKVNNAEHRRSVLGHELSHVLRFDAAVNLLQTIAQALFWFHPFVWWANRKIRAEREKCCDEMTIAHLNAQVGHYSRAIVDMLVTEHESTRPIPSLAVAGPVKNIEERIKTMMKPGKKFYKHPSMTSATVILLLTLLIAPTALVLTARADVKAATESEGKPNKSLHQAAADGDIEQVRLLLSKGTEVDKKDRNDQTALHCAVQSARKEVVELLIAQGADVNAQDENGFTPLIWAVWEVDENAQDIVDLLIVNGADVNKHDKMGCTPLYWAAFSGDPNMFKMILGKDVEPSTIHMAAYKGDLAKVRAFIEADIDVDAKDEFGCTALLWAVAADELAIADFLIAKGANLNTKADDDKAGFAPLTVAPSKAMIERLISSGADLNIKTFNGRTKLHGVCMNKEEDLAELLIREGANVNAKDKWGNTPLHLAASKGYLDIAKLLIHNGADIDAKTVGGHTPLWNAKEEEHTEIVELLRAKGAREKHMSKN